MPNQPGLPSRSVMAAAVICGFLVPLTGVHAQEPYVDSWDEGGRGVAEVATARAATPPRVTNVTHSFTGSVHEEIRVNIRFSQNVTGFQTGDIVVTGASVDRLEGSGSAYSLYLTTDENHVGAVSITIPAGAAENADDEGNIARAYTIPNVDNKRPVHIDATVNGERIAIRFDERLNQSAVPAVNEFAVSFTRGGTFLRRTVSRVDVSGYQVLLRLDGPVERGDAVEVLYFDTGPNALRDLVGNRVAGFENRAVRNITSDTPTGLPGAPRNLTAETDGPTAIDLDWLAPTADGGARITAYRIEVSENGGTSWSDLEARTSDTATAYSDTDVEAGETRHYRVSAINFNGTGPASNVAHATTRHVLPSAPRRLTARARGTSAIDLRWSAPSSLGSSPITGYRIDSSPTGTGRWSELVANTGSTSTTYTHDRLDPGTTRHYRVRAITRAGPSELVEHRPRDHRSGLAGPAQEPECGAERLERKRPTPPHLVGSGRRRRERDHRLQDREVRHPCRRLDTARDQHRQRGPHLHRQQSQSRHHLVLSRVRDQQQRAGRTLQRGQRHHQRRSSRAAATRACARDRTEQHPPCLGPAGDRRRGARHRLRHPEDRAQRQRLDHPPFQHGDEGNHVHGHRTGAGDPVPVPGRGHQRRGPGGVLAGAPVAPGGGHYARRLRRGSRPG